jgi:hypothetical protein
MVRKFPERILDEDLCRGMERLSVPALSITAFLALRDDLIDAQPRSLNQARLASEASSPGAIMF